MTALRAALLQAAKRGPGHGVVPRGTRPGDGFAFDRLRSYADGDDPRRIDWCATARIGALQTRVYLEETLLVLAALVDESPSMRLGRRRPLSAAADEAVRTWFAAAASGDRAERLVDEQLVGGRRAAVEVRAQGRFDLHRSLELALRALPPGSSLLLITDGLDLPSAQTVDERLARLARRFDATVLLAADPWADDLPVRGLVHFRDAETGRRRWFFVGRTARERYRKASAARDATLRDRFARAGWRVGRLDEGDGGAALERTFGLR